jgi:hypothetical protein
VSATTCMSCTAETSNGLALCKRCQQTLTESLVNTAAYYGDVDRIKPGQRVKVRSAYQSTPPPGLLEPRDPIADALDHVAVIVFGWCQNLEDDRPVQPMPATTERRCGWLESHAPTILTLEWAGELLREMLDCERMLRRILDRADTGWYAGECGNEVGRETTDDGDVLPVNCERHLYGTTGTSWVRCPECGRTWDASERRSKMIADARNEHAPVSVIAAATVGLMDGEHSVKRLANRIDQWVKRERLTSMGVRVLADGKPHRVYRLGDVFDLLGLECKGGDVEAC